MNKLLTNKYGFKNRVEAADKKVTSGLLKVIKNPALHFIIFGIIVMVIGYLCTFNWNYYPALKPIMKELFPYQWSTALASTFSLAIAAVGFCLLMGYSGLASLGTGGFIGIGCMSVHYIMTSAGLPFMLAIVVAIAVAVVIGAIVGFISLRIEGIYLVILTLGLSEILRKLFEVLQTSVTQMEYSMFFGLWQFDDKQAIYVVVVALVLVMILTNSLISSPTGRAMLAMKNSTPAAQAMGISLMKYRLLAFILCTVYASLAGTMFILSTGSVSSADGGTYALITSLNILAAVIIGGYRSIWGAVAGTFIMYGLKDTVLMEIPFFVEHPEFITLVSGVLVILVVMFYPGGLAQLVKEIIGWLKKLFRKIKEAKYGKDLG